MVSLGSGPTRRRIGAYAIVAGALLGAVGLTRASEPLARDPSATAEIGRRSPATNLDRLAVLDWSLWSVGKYYVDPGRVDPQRVMLSALESLEAEIPSVLVSVSDDQRVHVQVGQAERDFSVELGGLWQVALRLREIFAFVLEHTELDAEARRSAEFALVDGVLRTLDPHTRLLRPEALDEMNQSTKGSFGGLGIEVGVRDDLVTILRVLDGTPAEAAGLVAGDRIVQVDRDSTVALGLSDTVALLKGPPDTEVVVYVRREGHADPLRYEVTRAIIKLDSVTADVLPSPDGEGPSIGLVQINRTFARTTGEELREELARLEAAGVQGLVLDMRQNPGGLLDAAVEVADAFLPGGNIVSTVGSADLRKVENARAGNEFPELPVVVLVDEGSASATEIVAGALRNHDRALIVGRRTFGKGSVQVLYDRKIGDRQLGLKLTRAQYLTPGEISIQSVGVSPDLETIPVFIDEGYAAYFGRKRFDLVREETLSQHLDHDSAAEQKITAGPLYYLQQGSIGAKAPKGAGPGGVGGVGERDQQRAQILLADPEIRLARDLVAWAPSPDRQNLLEGLPQFAADWAEREQARITESLAMRGIDWSPPPEPVTKPPSLRVELSTDAPDNSARAGDKLTLTVRVTNTGQAPAYRVRTVTDSDYGYYDERELLFGRIEPGQSLEQKLTFAAANYELTRRDRVDFDVHAAGGTELAQGSTTAIELGVQSRARPNFTFGWRLIDDPAQSPETRGDGDGVLEAGELAEFRVFVSNRGEGSSLDTTVRLRSTARSPMFFDNARTRIGRLEPGAEKAATFMVELKGESTTSGEPLTVTVADNKVGESLTHELSIPTVAPGAPERTAMVSPPRVELQTLPVSTDATQVSIRGRAVSQVEGVRDLFVTVYNPARHPFEGPQKVYYVANPQPGTALEFEAMVPLDPGNNLIEVVARGEGDVVGWSRRWILRRSGLEAARAVGD